MTIAATAQAATQQGEGGDLHLHACPVQAGSDLAAQLGAAQPNVEAGHRAVGAPLHFGEHAACCQHAALRHPVQEDDDTPHRDDQRDDRDEQDEQGIVVHSAPPEKGEPWSAGRRIPKVAGMLSPAV